MSLRIFVFLIGVSIVTTLQAQPVLSTKNKKAIELYTEADNYRVRGQYREALSLLDQAIEKDRNFSEAYFRQALIYKSQRNYPQSTEIYLKGLSLTTDQKKQKAYFYELGENYLLLGEYEKSLQFLDRYLDAEILNKQRVDQASMWKRNAQYALRNIKISSQFKPHQLSDTVNAFAMQYFPVLTADEQELIFTRRMGGGQDDDEDLVVAKKDTNGKWQHPVSISANINSPMNEGTCTISADGRQ
ncbi:MAG TPA: hypothetical protein PLR06_05365, partial [Cyclobacteriaceae bacterium]|nr:hypothetical protein [Cyclobacteriaceae bacterium]